jgi:DTW domain-containing protein YfiP
MCSEIPTIATRTRIVIVRHRNEKFRSSNTGRLAHLALPNSAIIEHPGELVVAPEAWLLFPEGTDTPAPPPPELIVLDASWSQARRMYRKLAVLRGLPILRLPDEPVPVARLRESPGPGRVSTIEAIARALRLLEGDEVAAPLERLFAVAVERARRTGRLEHLDR